jgi:hypothetical protein
MTDPALPFRDLLHVNGWFAIAWMMDRWRIEHRRLFRGGADLREHTYLSALTSGVSF